MALSSEPIIADLKEHGVKTVFRYYASGFQSQLPEKRIEQDEFSALLDAGLSIGIVFQYNNNKLESMTPERGKADAEFCIERAEKLGQPMGSAIYFGVDGDWWKDAAQKRVMDYFDAINNCFADHAAGYVIGVYGSGTTCSNLKKADLAQYFWLPLSTGWSGTKAFFNLGQWHIYQNYHGLHIGGRYTDTNILRIDSMDVGVFDKDGVISCKQDSSVRELRRFVSASSLNLRAAPSISAPVVDQLKYRKNVIVISEADNWCAVSKDETPTIDGYCYSPFLVSLDMMP